MEAPLLHPMPTALRTIGVGMSLRLAEEAFTVDAVMTAVGRTADDQARHLDGCPLPALVAPTIGLVLLAVGRRLVPQLIEGTLIPTLLFYGLLTGFGIRFAFAGALCWSYTALARRAVGRRPIPPILILASLGITVRTLVTLGSGSTFVYFLQPVLGTVAVGGLFLCSIALGRPLIARFAADFCPLPPDIASRPGVTLLYRRLTFLWAGVNLVAASTTFLLLVTLPLPAFVVVRALTGWVITVSGIVATVTLAVRAARREDLMATVAPGGRLTAVCRSAVAPLPVLSDLAA
jgi:hypothetical protein